MKKLIALTLLVAFSCQTQTHELVSKTDEHSNKQENESKKETLSSIYITTYTANQKKGEKMTVDNKTSIVNSDYFEIGLGIMGDNKTYMTNKEIEKPTMADDFHSVSISITDEKGDLIKFSGTTEFLNFMSSHGYEMVDQVKNKYGADYTFKKKI